MTTEEIKHNYGPLRRLRCKTHYCLLHMTGVLENDLANETGQKGGQVRDSLSSNGDGM